MPGSRIYSPSGLIDCARGIIPTVSAFDVNPTDLANCTDGSLDTCTGEGTRTLAANGTIGDLELVLPQNGVYLIGGKFRLRRVSGDAGSLKVVFYSKPNGTNYKQVATLTGALSTDGIINVIPTVISGTDFYFNFRNTGADGADVFGVTIYSVWAYKLR